MKKSDIIFLLLIIALFLPFFVSESLYAGYQAFNAAHGMAMSFVKFAVLATLGEMFGLRLRTGKYHTPTFGLFPRMVIWGWLGMGINMAMIIFSKGTPLFLEYLGMTDAANLMNGPLCLNKVLVALSISVAMNTIFAPVFMTLHKITDAHIAQCGGSAKALVTPLPMTQLITHLDWGVLWNFVFKKTIPLFWYPAHTLTFLLPADMRVLFAALLGVVLGVLLAIPKK